MVYNPERVVLVEFTIPLTETLAEFTSPVGVLAKFTGLSTHAMAPVPCGKAYYIIGLPETDTRKTTLK